MASVGIIGWRGMVGSVLLARMAEENDFQAATYRFYSTSQAGEAGPEIDGKSYTLLDANDLTALGQEDIILSCQGSGYTQAIHPALRAAGWTGYWLDAASALRMDPEAVIVLDPVNRGVIDQALAAGKKDFIGGNCTVSLMLMALGGLFEQDWVEWLTSMTYQAASGAGAKNMRELVEQMGQVGSQAAGLLADPATRALALDQNVRDTLVSETLPQAQFGAPLAGSLIPWVDRLMEDGRTREEWKGAVETNKILGHAPGQIPIDGCCVRIGAMRCHSQAFTIKLKQDIPLAEIEQVLANHNPWVCFVANNQADSLQALSPARVTGRLEVPVGRVRKMQLGPEYLTAFTVGDQLLWGAAEPVRRMLRICLTDGL